MITILRTAAGSPVAPSIINHIKEYRPGKVRIIAADMNPDSCGFHFADASYTVPQAADNKYIEELIKICLKEKVDLFMPDLDEELMLVSESVSEFDKAGTKCIISPPEVLKICTSKYKTYEFLLNLNIPVPVTFRKEDINADPQFPLLAKPEYGRGSQGIELVHDKNSLQKYIDHNQPYVFQEYLPGDEYTIDALSDPEGKFLYCSIRKRIKTDSGISVSGETVSDIEVSGYVESACNALGLAGPSCFQCKRSAGGTMKFIEINPRIAGSAILSIKAGADILHDMINVYTGRKIQGLKNYKTGFRMIRYWSEIFQ